MKMIKGIITVLLVSAFTIAYAQRTEHLSYGAGYANDIYYKLSDGSVTTVPNNNWDIAIESASFSANIIINEGAGVRLYEYSTDTTDWSTLDTTGFAFDANLLLNSKDDWEEGAFVQNATGHPDYGWGAYTLTHEVKGTDLYIILLRDGSYKKLVIDIMKTTGEVEFHYANLDGSNRVNAVLQKPNYSTKYMGYYDMQLDVAVDREPVKGDWDIVFTRWVEELAPGFYQPLTGALTDRNVKIAKVADVDTNTFDFNAYPYDSSITTIGYDWKSFDMGTFQYVIEDSLVFFVKTDDTTAYKVIFKSFAGSSTGDFSFSVSQAVHISVPEFESNLSGLKMYPNPANNNVNFEFDNVAEANEVQIDIYSIYGQVVVSKTIGLNSGMNTVQLNNLNLPTGNYIANLTVNGVSMQEKLVITQ